MVFHFHLVFILKTNMILLNGHDMHDTVSKKLRLKLNFLVQKISPSFNFRHS